MITEQHFTLCMISFHSNMKACQYTTQSRNESQEEVCALQTRAPMKTLHDNYNQSFQSLANSDPIKIRINHDYNPMKRCCFRFEPIKIMIL
mmetsp:Transcript_10441/g.18821  ORF Transcript_10441/g.18821 Transcript_10441/m.18821 type:complete len:91 (-) Transcript_10441:317-589(-)